MMLEPKQFVVCGENIRRFDIFAIVGAQNHIVPRTPRVHQSTPLPWPCEQRTSKPERARGSAWIIKTCSKRTISKMATSGSEPDMRAIARTQSGRPHLTADDLGRQIVGRAAQRERAVLDHLGKAEIGHLEVTLASQSNGRTE